jgi:hypothetical protein
MQKLGLSVTANQNSIPRELVYDVDAMLQDRLAQVPFPFIGGSVPEGHQGQSVEGMTHASILAFLKIGFHRRRIPWGFNADHQPIGGQFDAIEEELAQGCTFAITSRSISRGSRAAPIESAAELSERSRRSVAWPSGASERLGPSGSLDETQCKRLFVYLLPAMRKLKKRDETYARIRRELFTEEVGRRFFRELSIDELPGRTTPETLALCLAMADARSPDPLRRAGDRLPEEFPLSRQLRAAEHGRRSLPGGTGIWGLDRVPLWERQVGGELPRRW